MRDSQVALTAVEAPEFIARIRSGDREAIEGVVEVYLAQVLRAARGAGLDAHQAEDVTQATFMTFIEAAPRFEGRSKVRTWLFGILYRKIAEARRARRRDDHMEEIDEAFERRFDARGNWSQPPQPVDIDLHHREVETEIFACLDAAPIRQALVFVLKEAKELSTEDICDVMGITRTNLSVMLHRIRNRVRDCLASKNVQM